MRTRLILIVALLLSNVIWVAAYRSLWYQAAEAEGHLDEAMSYIHNLQR